MTDSYDELLRIAQDLEQLAAQGHSEEIWQPLERLQNAASRAYKAWSGSWLGYHANVYYKNLQPPPPGAHFSLEWGLNRPAFEPKQTTGEWVEYDPDEVISTIHRKAGISDLNQGMAFKKSTEDVFAMQKGNLLSIIEIDLGYPGYQFLKEQKEKINDLSFVSEQEYLERWQPRAIESRDHIAVNQGVRYPPHFRVLARVTSIQNAITSIEHLAHVANQLAAHISRQRQQLRPRLSVGTRIFIGHGNSQTWRELKDFLEDRLDLLVDEFNRVPSAGMSTSSRLSAMLDTAAIALLVMTGEDEQPDGQLRARENVVHEAGLFQGRLGFERAIVLLEEGCEEFSNIIGLGQIRFPRNNISAAFEEIRRVLEREGVLKQVTTP